MSTAPGPTEIESLLSRGDDYLESGNARAAVSFYQGALELAAQTRFLDSSTVSRLRNAQAFIQARVKEFEHALDQVLETLDAKDSIASLRLRHSLEMVKGEREIYPQQPSMLYYPYLAQRQFFEREEFDWARELEEAAPAIRQELIELLASDAGFRPYVEDDPNLPLRDFHGLNNNEVWTALYLWKHGIFVPEVADRCPATVQALEKVPLSRIGNLTPSVFFSRLEPGTHIPPHRGMLNTRLICHLPLVVPNGCWLRVGNETREWEEGKLVIFDDSIEHEAKNPSGDLRVVLIFDIWRPELSSAEREGISTIFKAIDAFRVASDD